MPIKAGIRTICPDCRGYGNSDTTNCSSCDGFGVVVIDFGYDDLLTYDSIQVKEDFMENISEYLENDTPIEVIDSNGDFLFGIV